MTTPDLQPAERAQQQPRPDAVRADSTAPSITMSRPARYEQDLNDVWNSLRCDFQVRTEVATALADHLDDFVASYRGDGPDEAYKKQIAQELVTQLEHHHRAYLCDTANGLFKSVRPFSLQSDKGKAVREVETGSESQDKLEEHSQTGGEEHEAHGHGSSVQHNDTESPVAGQHAPAEAREETGELQELGPPEPKSETQVEAQPESKAKSASNTKAGTPSLFGGASTSGGGILESNNASKPAPGGQASTGQAPTGTTTGQFSGTTGTIKPAARMSTSDISSWIAATTTTNPAINAGAPTGTGGGIFGSPTSTKSAANAGVAIGTGGGVFSSPPSTKASASTGAPTGTGGGVFGKPTAKPAVSAGAPTGTGGGLFGSGGTNTTRGSSSGGTFHGPASAGSVIDPPGTNNMAPFHPLRETGSPVGNAHDLFRISDFREPTSDGALRS